MAEAAKKAPEPKAPEAAAPAPHGAEEQKPKAKPDLFSIATIALVAINLAAIGGMAFYMKKLTGKVADLKTQVENVEIPEAPPVEAPTNGHAPGAEITPPIQGTLFPLESFLVNITSEQGPKFLQTQMELELADPSVEEEITRKKAAIRDAIIVLLSSRSYKDLRDQGGIIKLRADIKKAINNLLSTGKVKEVFFTQFHFN